ncbi:MAG: hypothetical protein Q4E99_05995, partial [Bacillota bacterium]|nr:hypothetical protein [Bacillota bacterium]
LLIGCSSISDKQMNMYYDLFNLLNDSEDYVNTSVNFSSSFVISENEDGYSFYIIIDKPINSMYDIKIMAIEDGADYSDEFISNIGVFEENSYNLVPNQVNVDSGYVKGLSISGNCTSTSSVIKCVVQWKDKNKTDTFREFLVFNGSNNSTTNDTNISENNG